MYRNLLHVVLMSKETRRGHWVKYYWKCRFFLNPLCGSWKLNRAPLQEEEEEEEEQEEEEEEQEEEEEEEKEEEEKLLLPAESSLQCLGQISSNTGRVL
jgi:flagellar biosynthesis/type III secretory pathway M-ring protein FliF/YscJ